MLDALRAWLNGKRDYFMGVALFAKLSDNKKLHRLLLNGPTQFNVKRLADELNDICTKMKEETPPELRSFPYQGTPEGGTYLSECVANPSKIKLQPKAADQEPVNPVLYQSCHQTAKKEYKETMDTRAVLFHLAKVDDYTDVNRDDLVKQRCALALQVVKGYNKASALFEQADYVKINGRLPGDDDDQEEDGKNDYDQLPDHLVHYTLDLLRKSYNKLKLKPETPERLQKLQADEKNIKKLELRWDLLKPR